MKFFATLLLGLSTLATFAAPTDFLVCVSNERSGDVTIVDGASQYQVFFQIMLPMAKPGLIAMGIFNFLGQWNQYILPLVLIQDSSKYVLTQGLAYLAIQQYYTNDWSALFAALVIVMIPTILVYAVFQGRLTRGITVGALKG